ncbi:MAG TPA: nucleotide exchange factor GrpE [Methylocystis sp.]|nr:nucleotide exchange factor GrpE [Methylocystis sp.]
MSDQNDNDTPPPAPDTPSAQTAPSPEAAELETLRADNAEMKDRLLRALAEMENLRRRTEREVTDARAYGMANFARETLALADNLRRALDAFPAAARETADPHVLALLEGVELTERDFFSRLARFGVKQIDALGARFDPNQHEALFEIPNESLPAGAVAQVVEPGYLIGERVLRPAKVGVARGGPKPGAPAARQE